MESPQTMEVLAGDNLEQAAREHYASDGTIRSDCGATEIQREGIDEKTMSARFVIVTRENDNDVNRNGNMVQIMPGKYGGGMLLGNHQRNPIVLLNHGQRHPHAIGLAENRQGNYQVKPTKKKCESTCFFRQSDPWGEFVFASVAEGYMRMASIGFRANKAIQLEQRPSTRKDEENPAVDFTQYCRYWDFVELELVEWSIVEVGADRGSFRQSLESGMVGQTKVHWSVRQYLEELAEDRPAWTMGWEPTQTEQQGIELFSRFGVKVTGEEGPMRQFCEWASRQPDVQPVETQATEDSSEETATPTPETIIQNDPLEGLSDPQTVALIGQAVGDRVIKTMSPAFDEVRQSVRQLETKLNYLSGSVSN